MICKMVLTGRDCGFKDWWGAVNIKRGKEMMKGR
jgi:hypothetical protein